MAINGAPAVSKLDANAKYSAYVSAYYVENGSGTKSGAFSKHYYAGSERIVSKTADDAYFYFTDHLGSTTHITDRSGDVAQYAAYTPYGSLFREYRSVQPYKFNGKELDQETGYYYYGARYYDPTTTLWLGTDPLKHKYPDIGAYVYCAGNPVKYVDLDGREKVSLGINISVGVQFTVGLKLPKVIKQLLPNKMQNIELSASVNMYSVKLVDANLSYNTDKKEFNGNFNYVGKNGKAEIEQSVSFVGFGIVQTFETNDNGYINGTQKTTITSPISKTFINPSKIEDKTIVNISVGTSAILGGEIDFSIDK